MVEALLWRGIYFFLKVYSIIVPSLEIFRGAGGAGAEAVRWLQVLSINN